MKKRHLLLVVTMVLACMVFTGCGRNDEENMTGTSEIQNDFMDGVGVEDPLNGTTSDRNQGDNTNAQENAGMGNMDESTGNTATDSDNGISGTSVEETSTVTGVVTEIKDFMFVIEDNEGMSYGFTFEGDMPTGLENVTEGDEVIVTYTGEVNEVDAFTGDVISVEKVEKSNR
ncbi:MAG: hypothetical protein IJ335_11515 [Lachnospiraceae bacterium]|nr:hypothetical protein [Lachnospiraceae bacterium]